MDQVLLAQRVMIKTSKGDVIGVIGAKPPHLVPVEERNKVIEKKDMYIDIGATSKEESEEAGVRIADSIMPVSDFTTMAVPGTYLAKAFDDRSGCAVTIATMQKLADLKHPNTVFGVATVQEEGGLRGAQTSVGIVDPDVAIILEDQITGDQIMGDIPEKNYEELPVKLGGGPILTLFDYGMIPNLKLRDLFISTAKKQNIPLQTHAGGWGGFTNGAIIQRHKNGVPAVLFGAPVRYAHSHAGIMQRDDFDWTVELLVRVIQELDQKTVAGLTSW